MAIHEEALAAQRRAAEHVPQVVRAFMRLRQVSQEHLGEALGLTQRQVSRRLNVPGSIAQEELAALAAFFGVQPATFYKSLPEALADLIAATKEEALIWQSAWLTADELPYTALAHAS